MRGRGVTAGDGSGRSQGMPHHADGIRGWERGEPRHRIKAPGTAARRQRGGGGPAPAALNRCGWSRGVSSSVVPLASTSFRPRSCAWRGDGRACGAVRGSSAATPSAQLDLRRSPPSAAHPTWLDSEPHFMVLPWVAVDTAPPTVWRRAARGGGQAGGRRRLAATAGCQPASAAGRAGCTQPLLLQPPAPCALPRLVQEPAEAREGPAAGLPPVPGQQTGRARGKVWVPCAQRPACLPGGQLPAAAQPLPRTASAPSHATPRYHAHPPVLGQVVEQGALCDPCRHRHRLAQLVHLAGAGDGGGWYGVGGCPGTPYLPPCFLRLSTNARSLPATRLQCLAVHPCSSSGGCSSCRRAPGWGSPRAPPCRATAWGRRAPP